MNRSRRAEESNAEIAMKPIPYARQSIAEGDVQAVVESLRSDWLTQGPVVPAFEQKVADYCGARYAVAVNSGTSALHLACLALGLSPGDFLWTSPLTFVASANCARMCGAGVDFVDIDYRTGNMSINFLSEKLRKAEKTGTLPKIVIPVHYAGQSCLTREIHSLSQRYGFSIIEDASHALGGEYLDTKVGSCRYSDVSVLSFHPVKIITSGEGGMVLTNSETTERTLRRLRSHGITREAVDMEQVPHGPWYYEQIDLGYNYRMTDLQAALGLSQTERLDTFLARRRSIARRYTEDLRDFPLFLPFKHPDTRSAWHLYVIRLCLGAIGKTRQAVFASLQNAGINVNVHYIPVHTQPYYQRLGFGWGSFPVAEKFYAEALSLPVYPDLTEEEQGFVVERLGEALG
ncbi:MAG TPA: UDP-4-amino-4,6-dideoxy-N-acetyl-beta-L-altrosamine transaminase [Atribacteraceae bacterium]|nr:UDP-4-amino-4,6-dideoxy-N-acetyl-beta-L-altrosamine transaminase [Atribacteraceae bacterium]